MLVQNVIPKTIAPSSHVDVSRTLIYHTDGSVMKSVMEYGLCVAAGTATATDTDTAAY
ncbi:GL26927 [Drosophila persimilis]|uniref:GL26927 n=1 Tax=Drosophila persimilis TaxID=7234 RepID=B4IS69_DROPE|nr:GL26927 [Drosophila persimilis]